MEDSNIKAKYHKVYKYINYYEDEDEDEDEDCESYNLNKCNNISKLSKYVKDYNFGDLVTFSDYRDTCTYIIGKKGKLIHNPMYGNSGYLDIPYEITQYLDNAIEKYSEIETDSIELRYDDKFIAENINTKSCKILETWNWKLTWGGGELGVHFSDDKSHNFDLETTNAYKIKIWFEASKEEQVEIKLYYEIKNDFYDKFLKKYNYKNKYKKYNNEWLNARPKIPNTWNIHQGSSGGGYRYHYSNYIYSGPVKDKEKVLANIKTFYYGFKYKIS